jgi:hypothetical protein
MSTYILRKNHSRLSDLVDGNAAFMQLAAAGGTVYYVDPASGSNANDGLTPATARATILSAYTSCVTGKNDIVALIANATSNTLSAALTWSKSYTHLVGLCAPTMTAQRARIFQLSTLTAASPLLTISGSGCTFSNFYIFQGVADATSLINVSVTGGRNYFENVHFAGSGHATQAIDGGHSLKLDGAEENTFVGCTFGVDTVDAVDGVAAVLFDTEAHRNTFIDCVFRMRCAAGDTGPAFVEVADATGIDRDTLFKNCTFLNNSATAMAGAFAIPAGMGAPRKLLLQDCMLLGVTKLDANDRGVLFGNMNDVTGADTSGVAVELVT